MAQVISANSKEHYLEYLENKLSGNEQTRDHFNLSQIIFDLLQRLIKMDNGFCRVFLDYERLQELYEEIFINLIPDDNQYYETHNHFGVFMTFLLDILKGFEEKVDANRLFNILFNHMIFGALNSKKGAFFILRTIGEIISKYNLAQDFNCDLNIFDIMKSLVEFMKQHNKSENILEDYKIEACLYILHHYLCNNQDKLRYFGQELGLVHEILYNGLFKVPSLDRTDGPKYHTKTLVNKAFLILPLLGRDHENLLEIKKILMPIHEKGIWRQNKPSAWGLTSNVKRRKFQYAGLKNMGCSNYLSLMSFNFKLVI